MKFVQDEVLLQKLLERENIPSYFETTGLRFRLVKYEKQELICAPDRPLTHLLFVVKGSVQVYGLREDGSRISVSRGVGRTILGTIEFARKDLPVFYTEAMEEVLCVALPVEKNRPILEQDRVFLRCVLDHLAGMILTFTLIGSAEKPVEERVLAFLRDIQPDHTLYSINEGLSQFHCSRRQLQRVLKGLCNKGILNKVGRGTYRLAELP